MSLRPKMTMWMGTCAVGVTVLLYVGSYLLFLRNESYFLAPYPKQRNRVVRLDAEYRFGGRVVQVVFAPANIVDRTVRPSRWHMECK